MLGALLDYLRQYLDAQLREVFDDGPPGAGEDAVVFVDGDKFEPLTFKVGAISLLLINLEEERILRGADPYVRAGENGTERAQPDIRLVLYVLCVARFNHYRDAWDRLSAVLEHLQTVRLLDRSTTTHLPPGIDKLVFELVTLGFKEQNDVWSALRTTPLPALLYRVKLVTVRDRRPQPTTPVSDGDVRVRKTP